MMDPAMMAALAGGGQGAPAPADPSMMGGAPPMGPPGAGTPADAALPVLLMLQQQQAQQQQQFVEQQKASMLSMLAEAVGSLPNPVGAAAQTMGAQTTPEDPLGQTDQATQDQTVAA